MSVSQSVSQSSVRSSICPSVRPSVHVRPQGVLPEKLVVVSQESGKQVGKWVVIQLLSRSVSQTDSQSLRIRTPVKSGQMSSILYCIDGLFYSKEQASSSTELRCIPWL